MNITKIEVASTSGTRNEFNIRLTQDEAIDLSAQLMEFVAYKINVPREMLLVSLNIVIEQRISNPEDTNFINRSQAVIDKYREICPVLINLWELQKQSLMKK